MKQATMALVATGAAALLAIVGWATLVRPGAPAPSTAAATPVAIPPNAEKATFAGGCFWCVEADFDKVPGVLSTTSGYIGGTVENPSYREVAAKGTGHAEAVEIVFDPGQVSYAQLVEHFWRTIDPTTPDRQFCDAGSPYRPAIFTHGPAQADAARASRDALAATKPFPEPIVVAIEPAPTFYVAEAYHQDYYLKNPVRYQYYRSGCGRDTRLRQLWGDQAGGTLGEKAKPAPAAG